MLRSNDFPFDIIFPTAILSRNNGMDQATKQKTIHYWDTERTQLKIKKVERTKEER